MFQDILLHKKKIIIRLIPRRIEVLTLIILVCQIYFKIIVMIYVAVKFLIIKLELLFIFSTITHGPIM